MKPFENPGRRVPPIGPDLGGPVVQHKAWFYFDYEQQRQVEQQEQRAKDDAVVTSAVKEDLAAAAHEGKSPLEVLQASGKLSPEEIALVRGALRKDAQASLRASEPGVAGHDSTHKHGDGTVKAPLSDAEKAALLKAHDVLLVDVKEGAGVRKVVPNSDLGALLHGETVRGDKVLPTDQMRGDFGLQRNTEGLNHEQTVARLGLDYEHNPSNADFGGPKSGQYTDVDTAGRVTLAKEVQENGLHFIDMPMSKEQAEAAKVPVGPDLHQHAVANSEYADRYTNKPRENGQDNPYAGTGATSSNRLVDGEGRPFEAAINQEMNAGAHPLQEGAQLKMRGAEGGKDQVVATYKTERDAQGAPVMDEKTGKPKAHWELSADLTPEQRAFYEEKIGVARDKASAAKGVSADRGL